jgi:virginiamycin B lyase
VVTNYSGGISAGANPLGITAGPDGNLWFTEYGGNRIGRITPLGVVTEFSAGISAGAGPSFITAGPDGNLWFAEYGGNRIGRITTGPAVAPPTDVPTLQQWALWLLGLLILIVSAGVRLRPHKKD